MSPAAPPLARLGLVSACLTLLCLAAHVASSRDRPAATIFTLFLAPVGLAPVGGLVVILGTAEFAVRMAPPLDLLAGLPDVLYWLATVPRNWGSTTLARSCSG